MLLVAYSASVHRHTMLSCWCRAFSGVCEKDTMHLSVIGAQWSINNLNINTQSHSTAPVPFVCK